MKILSVLFRLALLPLIIPAALFLSACGMSVATKKIELDETEHDQVEVAPDPEADPHRRQWVCDNSPAGRLDWSEECYGRQAAQVGMLPESVETWFANKQARAAASN